MAKYKGDPANTGYNAGDTFDYEVWTADTELTLCNVRWDAVYKDAWFPATTNELNEWIDANGDTTTISNAMYARIDEPISIDMPLGRAQRYNYIRVFNPAQPTTSPDSPKYYYYFIRGVRHINPETTEIVVQLDVWQTYIRLIQFGRAYIERGHAGIANEVNFRNHGRDFLTVAEGLDTGSEYMNVSIKRRKVMAKNPAGRPDDEGISILAISTVDLHGDLGDRVDPKNPSAKPTGIQGMPSGAAAFIWESASEFMAFMVDFSTKPWATSGLVSITLIPSVKRYLANGQTLGQMLGQKNAITRSYSVNGFNPFYSRKAMFPNWRESTEIVNYIPPRYRHLKKFLTSPYCQIEMTFGTGSAIVLKPESWNADDAPILELISIMPPNQRMAIIPAGYNGRNKIDDGDRGIGTQVRNDWPELQGDGLDMALFLSGFPTIPIVNNGQIQYLASNAKGIASQYSSNSWAQQRALQGNQVSFDQATAGINAGNALANNAISADQQQTAIQMELASQQALLNLFGGTAAGAGMGAFAGPAGAIAGGVGGLVSGGLGMIGSGMQADAANKSLAARTNTAGSNRDINAGLGSTMRDSNKGLADWAARGDYANQRAALDAKIQDTAMIPHGTSGQFGGESFNLANDLVDLTLKFKMLDQASISVIGEYWLRYGYPVRRSARIPNDLRVMSKFSYWKLSEVYIITGGMPESHKQTLRGILEKGVTVWTNPDDIGEIDFADNVPIPGYTLEGYIPPDWEPEPEPEVPIKPKKRNKKMLVYATNDGGMKYALAGSAPGTTANFLKTESTTLAESWLDACGVTEPVLLDVATFYDYEVQYLSPVSTLEVVEGP